MRRAAPGAAPNCCCRGQRRLLRRAEADLLKSSMACQGGVEATVGHILAERLVGKTQAEIGGMNRQAHAATMHCNELTGTRSDHQPQWQP